MPRNFPGTRILEQKEYTILFVSPNSREAHKFVISHLFLGSSITLLALLLIISSWILHDYLTQRKKSIHLQELLKTSRVQRDELQGLRQKFQRIEEELHTLQKMEVQIQKDWQEIKKLSQETKMTPVNMVRKDPIPDLEEKISILDEPRSWLIRRLHHDLFSLRQSTLASNRNLDDLWETLNLQKSILMATPSLWPVAGRITSAFGETRVFVASGATKPHKGIDIAASMGTPILSPAAGVVLYHDSQPDYGNMIYIDHGHGFATKYGHLQKIQARTGKKIQKGEIIGTVGMSGFSNGPHLHYEVLIHGKPVNPYAYLTDGPLGGN